MTLEKIVLLKLNDSRVIPTLPKDMQKEKLRPLQSEFKPGTRDVIRGFDPILERILLPSMIGTQPGDVHFAARVRDFWADINILPTEEGLRLNVATEKKTVRDSEGQDTEIDFPVNPDDYMVHQIALQSCKVAKTPAELENLDSFDFYLVDLAAQEEKEIKDFEIVETADLTYSKLVSNVEVNEDKINWVLDLLRDKGVALDIDTTPMNQKKMFLRKIKEEQPLKFTNTVNDPALATKAFITRLLTFNVITKEGNDLFDGDVNIGNGKVAIAWFGKAENSGKKLALESRLKSAIELKRK